VVGLEVRRALDRHPADDRLASLFDRLPGEAEVLEDREALPLAVFLGDA
jgi:hypothetical protein